MTSTTHSAPSPQISGKADENEFSSWIGREQSRTATMLRTVTDAMAAVLDLQTPPDEVVAPGWQWLFFNESIARSGLGQDGHPKRGGFLPPIASPRRMWAGSRIRYVADLPLGVEATRTSRILDVKHKTGRSGSLWFVTVEHTISCEGTDRIVEEQDLVYRDAAKPRSGPAKPPAVHGVQPQWSEQVEPDEVLLFRYSALTFNSHRIHYDQPYATNEEGYEGLVVHGPLAATLLQGFAIANARPGHRLISFDYRGVAPLIVNQMFTLEGREGPGGAWQELWVRGPKGELALSATATFEDTLDYTNTPTPGTNGEEEN